MPPRESTTANKTGRHPVRESSPQRAILAAIQSRTFAPVYYFHGDDDYLKDVAVQDLLEAALDPSTKEFNCEIRRAGELTAENVNDVLGTPPMFAERRAVVIRDVPALRKAARQQLDLYLKRPASDTLLILVSPADSKADTELSDNAVTLVFQPLPPDRVTKWIQHHVESVLHVSISGDAIQLLQQAVGNDLHSLHSELDKCASFAEGAHAALHHGAAPGKTGVSHVHIDADAVTAVVGVRRGETVTDLVEAVGNQDAVRALNLLPHVLAQPKVSAVQVVIMLSLHTFALAYGRAKRDSGVPASRMRDEYFAYLKDTGGYVGRPWAEAASIWTKQLDLWNSRACERALALLLHADMAIKNTAVSNADQMTTSLVLALCALRTRHRKVA